MGCYQSKTADLGFLDGNEEQAAAKVASYNLSDIPDEILSHIISFIPIKDAVCTSVLSRRWRYIFTLMTNLNIVVPSYHEDQEKVDRFLNFLDRLVSSQDIRSILRFRFYSTSNEYIDPQQVHRLICALAQSKIQELDLMVTRCGSNFLSLLLPENLFACENLVVLKLNFRGHYLYFELKFPARICLPRLVVLRFVGIKFPDDGSEERFFSSCPVLKDLALINCSFIGCVKFNISNPSLERLTVTTRDSSIQEDVPILINAPNMVFLSFSISSSHSLEFVNVKSLAEADFHPQLDEVVYCKRFSTAARVALSQIQNIATLRINTDILFTMQSLKVPIPLFDKMTCLKIPKWEYDFQDLDPGYFLAGCVVLETLVFGDPTTFFEWESEDSVYNCLPPSYKYTVQDSRLDPLFHHLKTIEVWLLNMARAEVLMEVIKFFLKHSKVLEEVKFNIRRQGRSEQQQQQRRSKQEREIMRKLKHFPIASKKCRVFCHIH